MVENKMLLIGDKYLKLTFQYLIVK